jgi:hypothetical protein
VPPVVCRRDFVKCLADCLVVKGRATPWPSNCKSMTLVNANPRVSSRPFEPDWAPCLIIEPDWPHHLNVNYGDCLAWSCGSIAIESRSLSIQKRPAKSLETIIRTGLSSLTNNAMARYAIECWGSISLMGSIQFKNSIPFRSLSIELNWIELNWSSTRETTIWTRIESAPWSLEYIWARQERQGYSWPRKKESRQLNNCKMRAGKRSNQKVKWFDLLQKVKSKGQMIWPFAKGQMNFDLLQKVKRQMNWSFVIRGFSNFRPTVVWGAPNW